MQRDGEIVVIEMPELLKDALGLAAGVDEDERGAVRLDQPVDLRERVARGMAGPRKPLVRVEHAHIRRGAALGDDEIGARAAGSAAPLRHHVTGQLLGLRHRRREAGAGQIWGEAKEPGKTERKKIAALRRDQRVQLVEHHAPERAEQIGRVGGSEQERKLLGRGEQDLRRIAALALALRGRRVAGACFDADRQPHLGDRRFQVARNVDGERLQRRNIKRVQAAFAAQVAAGGDQAARRGVCSWGPRPRRRRAQLHQARQKAGERLAAARRRDEKDRAAGLRLGQKVELVRRAASNRGWRTRR